MICFEVSVNGNTVCVAGVGAEGVLSAILSWAQKSPEFRKARGQGWTPSEPHLHVGGLVKEEHLRWLNGQFEVAVGDEVTVRVIEADTVDEPVERQNAEDPTRATRVRYEMYQIYKREFEAEGVLLPENELQSERALHLRRQLLHELKREIESSE